MTRRAPLVALLLAALVGLGVLAVDVVAEPAVPTVPSTTAAPPTPTSGAWVCPVGDRRPGTALTVVTARPDAIGARPATVELAGLELGVARATSVPELFPATDTRLTPLGGAEMAVAASWAQAPVALTRQWRLEEADDLPPGTVAGGCVQPFAERWIIPGMSTVGGEDARLRLANPFGTDATVAIGFRTPGGPEQPLALRNLSVPARGTLEVDVGEHLPERADLAAVVEVRSGRVAVEGYQLARAAIGGIDGASLLAAATAESETWTVPWVADGEGTAAWLWVTNLGERTAAVTLTLHTAAGGEVPVGLTEVSVPPDTVRRIDLRGTLPEGAEVAAVTTRSDGAPVVVSAAVTLAGEAPAGTGYAVQLGVPDLDRSWVVSGGSTRGRVEELHLVNPGGEPATVDVAVFNGAIVLRPDALQELVVPAGATRTISVDEVVGEVGGWSAYVSARSGAVVVGRHGRGRAPVVEDEVEEELEDEVEGAGEVEVEVEGDVEGPLHLVAHPGVPSAAWRPPVSPLAGGEEEGFVRRLRTSLGLEPDDPLVELERQVREDLPDGRGGAEDEDPGPAG